MLNKRRQELIIQNLKSISSQVRLMAVDQLLNLPSMPSAEKIKYLEVCLKDTDDGVRASAENAISKLGGNAQSPSETTSLKTETAVGFAKAVAGTANNSVSDGVFALPELILEPTSPMDSVEAKTVGAFSKTLSGFPNIDSTAGNQDIKTSSEQKKASVIPIPKSDLIDGSLDDSFPSITGQTDIGFLVQHIRTISTNKPSGYLTRLFELSKSAYEEVALTALQALFNAKDKRVPPHVLDLLNNPEYTSQRRFLMLKIVMEFDIPFNADLLENILVKEKDVIVKSGLVKVFAKNCGESGVPLLIKCLKDEDPRVRANTVEVIEAQKIKGCENEIFKLLNDSENRVKVNAAKYLVKIGYKQAFYTLRAMLVSPELWLRDSVIFALGEIGDQASLVLLKAALKDPNQGIRLSVLKALSKMNNVTSRQILKAACGDPDPVVAQIATSLFDKIKDTPANPVTEIAKTDLSLSDNTSGTQVSKMQQPVAQPAMPSIESLAPKEQEAVSRKSASGTTSVTGQLQSSDKPSSEFSVPALPKLLFSETATTPKPAPQIPAVKISSPQAMAAYKKLCSSSLDEQRQGIKDTIFIAGADHMILLAKAMTLADISIRVATVKLLSRQRNPQAKEMLMKLSSDSNETVSSLAKKVLTLF